ncbi:hypothetical protein HDV02_003737 [Globomyces sp. JEL0801]|nr:hypothetical protein HDV02_003737 [Globomyces sp. JEL0801]
MVYEPLNPQQQIGTILNNEFQLLSILGEGRHLPSQQKVAIKCLYKTGLSDLQISLQREESLTLAKLNHINIIRLLSTIDTKDHVYLVLEYCEIDLFDCIMKKPFNSDTALKLFSELVEAVAYCHENGVYHRDLKPENIMLTNTVNPSIKLTDFGLSTTDMYSTEYGCGSVRYMAPECLKSPKSAPYLSSANDVWSLGIILINMLTGKNPWVEPHPKDKHFKSHLLLNSSSVDTFSTQFSFSESFCQVLRLVFDLHPHRRPTARQFLGMIKQIPSFFRTHSSVQVPKRVPYKPPHQRNGLLSPTSVELSKPQGFPLPPTPNSLMDSFKPQVFPLPATPNSLMDSFSWRGKVSPASKIISESPNRTQSDENTQSDSEFMFEMEIDETPTLYSY